MNSRLPSWLLVLAAAAVVAALFFFLSESEPAPEAKRPGATEGAGPQETASNTGDAGREQPQDGGKLTLALQADGLTLDPHKATDAASMHLIENLYNTLMRYAPEYGDVQPDLARSYEISDDKKTYTFHLHPEATFHGTGRTVSAADVKFSVERIRSQKVRAHHFEAVESIETPDDETVVFHLEKPVAPFLTYLAHPMNAVIDRNATSPDGALSAEQDAGSGPFSLVSWKKGDYLVAEAHDEYHKQGKPYLETLRFRFIPDETARTTALRGGEVDLVLDVPAKDRSVLEKQDGIVTAFKPGTFWEYVGMNTGREPFDSEKVRQAVAWSLDRSMVNKLVKFSNAAVLDGGPIPPNHWAHAGLQTYDRPNRKKARRLLKEAGFAGGFKTTLLVGSSFRYQVEAAQVVKEQLGKVGVDVTVRSLESSVLFERLGSHDFAMSLVGWVGFVDPDQWFGNIFHSDGKWNQQQYTNSRVDGWIEKARRTHDRDRRKELYTRIQEKILEDAPMAFLYVNPLGVAYGRQVRGFVAHATATTRFLESTWLDR